MGDALQTPCALGYPEVVSAFGEVAHAIGGEVDLDTLLHLVAERICALLGIQRSSVYLRAGDSDVFRGQVGHCDLDIDAGVKRLSVGFEVDGFTREFLRSK